MRPIKWYDWPGVFVKLFAEKAHPNKPPTSDKEPLCSPNPEGDLFYTSDVGAKPSDPPTGSFANLNRGWWD